MLPSEGETDRLYSRRATRAHVPRVFSAEGCHLVEEATANDAS